MSDDSMPRRVARAATAPVRDYLNQHFELVKEEIRRNAPHSQPVLPGEPIDLAPVLARLDELAELLAEQAHHRAAIAARTADEIAALQSRIEELERTVRQLALVVAPVDVER